MRKMLELKRKMIKSPSGFWAKVDKSRGARACWPWLSTKNHGGYGVIDLRIERRRHGLLAHRVAYMLTAGSIPEGLVIRHKCHVPECCNPAHLIPGTDHENVADSVEAGRFDPGQVGQRVCGVRGEDHPASKYSNEQRDLAVKMAFVDRLKSFQIAARIGCCRQTVARWLADHRKTLVTK